MTALVHTPIAHWAKTSPNRCAIACGSDQLSFAQLHTLLRQRESQLQNAPATCWVNDEQHAVEQLLAFLSIISTGRCATVSDPDWPLHVRQSVLTSIGQDPFSGRPTKNTDPFYIGFTSGSTGLPKGFQRHHLSWVESFRVCAETFGLDHTTAIMAPGRMSHSLFLFGMLMGLWTGAGIAIQHHFSASHTLSTLHQGHHACLVAVPSQLMMMLQWAKHRQLAPVTGVRLILISGARWMQQHTPDLQALFPNARIVSFYGASETSFIAWKDALEPTSEQAVGRPFANVELQIRPLHTNQPVGLIYVRSPMLFMQYVHANHDHTAAVRDGDWLTVGDMGYLDAQGQLCLAGRQNRMIVTQGKNLFPEEIEHVLASHPCVKQVVVVSTPDTVRGSRVVAVLQFKPESDVQSLPNAWHLQQWCQARVETFKVPRQFFSCDVWPLTPSGKTDLVQLSDALTFTSNTSTSDKPSLPCLHALS